MKQLDKSDFDEWLKHPVTYQLYLVFQDNKQFIEEKILGLDTIFDDKFSNKMTYYSGCLEMINKLLDSTIEQLFTTEEEKSDEEPPYSW